MACLKGTGMVADSIFEQGADLRLTRPDTFQARTRQQFAGPFAGSTESSRWVESRRHRYLLRYTRRTAIGNERFLDMTEREVAFAARANDHAGKS